MARWGLGQMRIHYRTSSFCCDMYYDYHDGAVMGDIAGPQKVPQPELFLCCGTDLPFCEIVHNVILTFSDFPFCGPTPLKTVVSVHDFRPTYNRQTAPCNISAHLIQGRLTWSWSFLYPRLLWLLWGILVWLRSDFREVNKMTTRGRRSPVIGTAQQKSGRNRSGGGADRGL